MSLKMQMVGGTAAGRHGGANEDRCWIDPERGAFILADGQGGEGFAAEAFVEGARAVLESELCPDGAMDPHAEVLVRAAQAGDRRTFELLEREKLIMGGGATAMLGVSTSKNLLIAYAGDGRLYRWEQGGPRCENSLAQLSRDHTWVQEMLEQGALTPKEAREHPLRTVATRGVGVGSWFPFDLLSVWFGSGGEYLACTAGVWRDRAEGSLLEAMASDSPESAVEALLSGPEPDAGGRSWGERDASAVIIQAGLRPSHGRVSLGQPR